jgi:hypothetical protein
MTHLTPLAKSERCRLFRLADERLIATRMAAFGTKFLPSQKSPNEWIDADALDRLGYDLVDGCPVLRPRHIVKLPKEEWEIQP